MCISFIETNRKKRKNGENSKKFIGGLNNFSRLNWFLKKNNRNIVYKNQMELVFPHDIVNKAVILSRYIKKNFFGMCVYFKGELKYFK